METASRSWLQSEAGARTITAYDTEPRNPEERNTFPRCNTHSVERREERKKLAYARVGACHKHRPRATRAERFSIFGSGYVSRSLLISLVRKTKVSSACSGLKKSRAFRCKIKATTHKIRRRDVRYKRKKILVKYCLIYVSTNFVS